MMSITKKRKEKRLKRKMHIKKKVYGTLEKPRLVVYRSLNHIYAQIVDDRQGKTLVAANSLMAEVKNLIGDAKGKIVKSKAVGKYLAEKALNRGISKVVFDRNGYKYHGRIKAVADSAREAGLNF